MGRFTLLSIMRMRTVELFQQGMGRVAHVDAENIDPGHKQLFDHLTAC